MTRCISGPNMEQVLFKLFLSFLVNILLFHSLTMESVIYWEEEFVIPSMVFSWILMQLLMTQSLLRTCKIICQLDLDTETGFNIGNLLPFLTKNSKDLITEEFKLISTDMA